MRWIEGIGITLVLVLVALLMVFTRESHGADAADAADPVVDEISVPIRIGWQIPAATQGQVLQVLKRTNVLEGHGLKPSFVPFSYGGPQVAAAFAGNDDGVGIIVPPNSPIQSVEDLEGKTVASPFGSVAHRDAFLAQEAVGLDPLADVENQNLDILEIRRRVLAGGNERWNDIDAAVVWDPIISGLELEGLARSVTSRKYLGVIVVSEAFIDAHPEAVVQLLVALMRSWDSFARQPDRVMQWYIDDTRLDYTAESLVAARLDPNFEATTLSGISLALDADYMAILARSAEWARDSGEGDVLVAQAVNTTLLTEAVRVVAENQFEDIEVILPSTEETAHERDGLFYELDSAPLVVVFAVMVLIAMLAIESGFTLGKSNREKIQEEQVTPIATVVGAVLALMAFVIAFTFGSANTRFDARKAALLDDVTAIQTAYLRANLIPEPHRTTVRSLLRDYVQARAGIVYAYGQPDTLRVVQERAEVLQELMWSHAETLADGEDGARVYMLFTQALNNVFNLHTKRVVLGAYYRIPSAMWLALIFASGVAMFAVGFQFGVGGTRRIHTANLSLSVTFAVVMVLAFDLDRAGEGLMAVNQQPMIDLYQSMRK
jgi:ABC-type nitrate/sulfonate/bicarbonate transport system substrate-binding protein